MPNTWTPSPGGLPPSSFVGRGLDGLRAYGGKVVRFSHNARLYLVNTALVGVAYGIYMLLFNFYVLSLGHNEAVAGSLLTVGNSVSLVGTLPMGYLSDRLGRKRSLLIAGLAYALAFLGMAQWRRLEALYLWNILAGLAQSLMGVTMAPFLMENSSEVERTYLFSFGAGVQTTSTFVGNWLGGRMPGWLAAHGGIPATSASAYGVSMAFVGGAGLLAVVPLLWLRVRGAGSGEAARTASPLDFARRHPRLLVKLIAPVLSTALGAGLLMPFMNLFFRSVHQRSDAAVGMLFAWGSLSMAVGLLVAPPLADRWGRIRVVVLSQALSIPFLMMVGFSPWYWASAVAYLVRVALMNMGWPVYDAFLMEHVESGARATVASLAGMCMNFGWAFSPMVSGWLQVRYGFAPVFLGTIGFYMLAVFLYWRFFWGEADRQGVSLARQGKGASSV